LLRISKKLKIFSFVLLTTFALFLIINVVLAEKKISTDFLNIFMEGNKYYKEGNYSKAIESYENLVKSGCADGVLYYNLGNAYENIGETGKAIAMYERAKKYIPRDTDLNYNLNLIEPQLKDISKPFILLLPFIYIYNAFAVEELLFITEALYFMVALFIIILILTKREGILHLSRIFLFILIPLFIYFGFMLGIRIYDNEYNKYCVVIEKEGIVYSGPGENYQIQFKIPEGAKLQFLKTQEENWVKVKLPNGDSGYIEDKAIIGI